MLVALELVGRFCELKESLSRVSGGGGVETRDPLYPSF